MKLVDILPLITFWLQVRVLPGPSSLLSARLLHQIRLAQEMAIISEGCHRHRRSRREASSTAASTALLSTIKDKHPLTTGSRSYAVARLKSLLAALRLLNKRAIGRDKASASRPLTTV